MEPQHERAITKNRLELVRRLIVNEEFLAAMESKNVITRPLREEIRALPGGMSQAGKLLDLLHCRGRKSFPVFLKALEETDQIELLELLKKSVPDTRPTERDCEHNAGRSASNVETDNIDKLVTSDCTNIDMEQITRLHADDPAIQERHNNPGNYSMTSNPCGRVLIINNTEFGHITDPAFPEFILDERIWSYIDAMNLSDLMEQFGFEVVIKSNEGGKLLDVLLKEEIETLKNGTYDCYMLVVLSYGSQGHIVMTDGKKVSPEWIQEQFTGTRLDSKINKPKIFLFHTDHVSSQPREATDAVDDAMDADGGEVFDGIVKKPPDITDKVDGKGRTETDAQCAAPPQPTEAQREHPDANFFVINSKAFLKQQQNMPWADDGSIFIRLLIHVITKYAHEDHFANMVQRANALLEAIRVKYDGKSARPFYSIVRKTTLKKDLFLYAKPAD